MNLAGIKPKKRTLSNKQGSEEGADRLVKRPSLNIKRNIFLVNVNVRVHMFSFIIKSWFYYCVSLNLQFISIFRAAWNIFTNSSRKQSLSADQGSINQNVLIQIGGRNINTHKIVETMVWQYHNLKYGQYSATEVTKFRTNIWRGKSRDWYLSAIFEIMISPDHISSWRPRILDNFGNLENISRT